MKQSTNKCEAIDKQKDLLNGGFWYKAKAEASREKEKEKEGAFWMMWYDILERSWILAQATTQEADKRAVDAKAVCKSKDSLDVPDVVASCDGHWQDMEGNAVAIKLSACVECATPKYFNALRRETRVE